MSIQKRSPLQREQQTAFVVPFADLDHTSLPLVGGKGANLGEMTQAKLPVPPGFCITTAAYSLMAETADLTSVLERFAFSERTDAASLAEGAEAARTCLLAASLPPHLASAIIDAYNALLGDNVAVAVRSSATAEDLPFASFAGQQDSYLNIVGAEAVLDAVKRCWASLWTERAVNYRQRLGIGSVGLAVVVQKMVGVAVAGILFTANPLTGKRRQAVIDANPGLGEAVVSGAVNPDHFVVDTTTGEIVERRLGDKRLIIQATAGGGTQRLERNDQNNQPCLTDQQIRALVALGARVEAHYSSPQDIEWAIDTADQLWLTQTRPITTLFPLPEETPLKDNALRVYFSFNVAQGVYRPLTPMGLQTFRLLGSSMATFFGYPPRNILIGPPPLTEAGQRLFLDVTIPLRNTDGRRLLLQAVQIMETRTVAIFEQLVTDPRLSLVTGSRWPLLRTLLRVLIRAHLPVYMLQALLNPGAARARVARLEGPLRQMSEAPTSVSAADRLALIERLIMTMPPRIVPSIFPIFGCGMLSFTLAGKLLGDAATANERQVVLRGLPHNPTTEMDLALWQLAQQIRNDAHAMQVVQETPLEELTQAYQHGLLPTPVQQGLAQFLQTYGHRGVAEIDLGLPRWSEDPTHILGSLANYLQLTNPLLAPDVQFQRSAQEAEAMIIELARRARRRGWLRGMLVHFLLKRVRALVGLREMPKYYLVLMMARIRALLWPIGDQLVQEERLEASQDIFFLSLPEIHAALSGTDQRANVRERHASYEQELRRRHIPRVLLSDGTEPEVALQRTTADGILSGTPASAGSVTGKARVVLEPTGAYLEPGEILVAPSTDPGWTPLFLTAGGLVMEMGGSMSHGAVVAREYGIPAVVGVAGATECITTGQQITVDGSTGAVIVDA